MFIPLTHHTVTVTGTVFKHVPCENCKQEYVYEMTRKVIGTAMRPLMLGMPIPPMLPFLPANI